MFTCNFHFCLDINHSFYRLFLYLNVVMFLKIKMIELIKNLMYKLEIYYSCTDSIHFLFSLRFLASFISLLRKGGVCLYIEKFNIVRFDWRIKITVNINSEVAYCNMITLLLRRLIECMLLNILIEIIINLIILKLKRCKSVVYIMCRCDV